jgi:hypothetical protein
MKIKTLIITMLFAVSMWAQTAAPASADKSAPTKATASCCKDGAACCKDGAGCCGKNKMANGDCCKENAACCKDGASCCGKDKMAKAGGKDCCGGKMCQRHKTEKS